MSEVKICKRKIVDVIVDYYKKGHTICDIIKLEDVPQNIQEKWFKESNFGKNTGYLFVEEIYDELIHWRYFNPIINFEVTSKTLDGLESIVNKKNEPFLIFNKGLANKSKNRDCEIYQDIIDEGIAGLKDSYYFDRSDKFKNLVKYANKFNKNQIYDLFEVMISEERFFSYFYYFKEILMVNEDRFGSDFVNEFTKNIIGTGINKLNEFYGQDNIFSCFRDFAEFFCKNQICELYDFLKKNPNYNYFNDFNYILEVNEDKLQKDFIEQINFRIIDDGINKLNSSNLNFAAVSNILKYLTLYSSVFSKNQFDKLCNSITDNLNMCGFGKYFHDILTDMDEESTISIDEICCNVIDGRINNLKSFNFENNISGDIINDLRYFASHFNKDQLMKLSKIIVANSKICDFASDFNHILDVNKDKFSFNFQVKLYNDIIESRIKELEYSDMVYYCMFDDLEVYANHFNKNQIRRFYDLIKNSNVMKDNEDAIFSILLVNKDNIGENIEEELTKIRIDNKLDELENLGFGYSEARRMLDYLRVYAKKFSSSQINRLCQISINNSQVYNCIYCKDSLKLILDVNKEVVDYTLYMDAITKNEL